MSEKNVNISVGFFVCVLMSSPLIVHGLEGVLYHSVYSASRNSPSIHYIGRPASVYGMMNILLGCAILAASGIQIKTWRRGAIWTALTLLLASGMCFEQLPKLIS